MNTGLIYVFTGEGKGKTSAALGVVTRALQLGKRVEWISFYKEESWGMAEKGLRDKFENLNMSFVGKGFRITQKSKIKSQSHNSKLKIARINGGGVVVDKASENEHREAVADGLRLAAGRIKQEPFLLVLDEILNAVSEGLLEEDEVIRLVGDRGQTHVVLTGRGNKCVNRLWQVADLVTECKKIKHPYDLGNLAVKGLDY